MSLREPTRDSHIPTSQADIWAQALCRDEDPELWFPHDGDFWGAMDAKQICRDCPLQLACLAEGMDCEYGIFGGLTPAERRDLNRGRTKQRVAA
jgi:hypothetical protein